MLVLSRKAGQQLTVGNDVVITLLKIDGQRVRLGIAAPRTVEVRRQELKSGKVSSNIED